MCEDVESSRDVVSCSFGRALRVERAVRDAGVCDVTHPDLFRQEVQRRDLLRRFSPVICIFLFIHQYIKWILHRLKGLMLSNTYKRALPSAACAEASKPPLQDALIALVCMSTCLVSKHGLLHSLSLQQRLFACRLQLHV